jgi:hypothetical protein
VAASFVRIITALPWAAVAYAPSSPAPRQLPRPFNASRLPPPPNLTADARTAQMCACAAAEGEVPLPLPSHQACTAGGEEPDCAVGRKGRAPPVVVAVGP